MDWHSKQDILVTESLNALDEVFSDPSALRRLRGTCDEFIAEKHFANILLRFRRSDSFRILDVGCGRGELIGRIAEFFPKAECLGMDVNAPSIERARELERENLRFRVGGFEDVDAEARYDAVICSEVIEHVVEREALLDRLSAALKPGGVLSISTPSGWMYRLPSPYNIYKICQNPGRFHRLYLTPEKHWEEALAIHPALQPSKLRRMIESRGFRLMTRQSSLWWLLDQGLTYRTFRFLERRGWRNAGLSFQHMLRTLDSLMNALPLFRIFESRFILMLEKTGGESAERRPGG
ncbi:MAG: class I SAM-dependent methyltransferase [Minwuia sp.]|uniref:class I SAM-dependent methyltransferase n=1 Tax=Minwuia sp. TaxID=2493630 RepID=UPI003A8AF467